jgi:hypothetical protein
MSRAISAVIKGWTRVSDVITRANAPRPDVDVLENFKAAANSLRKLSPPPLALAPSLKQQQQQQQQPPHPLLYIAHTTRSILRQELQDPSQQDGGSVSMALLKANKFLEQQAQQYEQSIASIGAAAPDHMAKLPTAFLAPPSSANVGGLASPQQEAGMRINFARKYFDKLQQLQDEKDIEAEALRKAFLHAGFSDAVLLGTSSERIAAHLKLFGANMTQDQFQNSMYAVLEPEVQTCLAAVLSVQDKALTKKNRAKATKVAKTFLLDVTELNVKVRCTMAWSDPEYSGFAAVEDDKTATVEHLALTRRRYFGAALDGVGPEFAAELVKDRHRFYAERIDNRETALKGTLFFIFCCFADWGLWAV